MTERSNQNDVIELDILEMAGYFLKHWYLFLLTTLLGAVIGLFVCTFFITPQYESTTKIIILNQQGNGSLTYSDMQLATQLTKDYEELIVSRDVLEHVISTCGLQEGYNTLLKRITVKNVSDTHIISITVRDPNPSSAQWIANTIREASTEHIRGVTDVEAVNMVEAANLPSSPASPSVKKWGVMSAAVGFVIMLAILAIRFLADDTIKNSDDVQRYLGLSTLALIPRMDRAGSSGSRSSGHNGKSSASAGSGSGQGSTRSTSSRRSR